MILLIVYFSYTIIPEFLVVLFSSLWLPVLGTHLWPLPCLRFNRPFGNNLPGRDQCIVSLFSAASFPLSFILLHCILLLPYT